LFSRVHFIGYLGGADKAWAYHAAELLVIPSRHEAMSIVALEAGITGTPVLLTDECGFDQIAEVNGGMVVAPSESGICQGLMMMLGDNTKLPIMGANLQKFIHANYTWNSTITKFVDLYTTILNERE